MTVFFPIHVRLPFIVVHDAARCFSSLYHLITVHPLSLSAGVDRMPVCFRNSWDSQLFSTLSSISSGLAVSSIITPRGEIGQVLGYHR